MPSHACVVIPRQAAPGRTSPRHASPALPFHAMPDPSLSCLACVAVPVCLRSFGEFLTSFVQGLISLGNSLTPHTLISSDTFRHTLEFTKGTLRFTDA